MTTVSIKQECKFSNICYTAYALFFGRTSQHWLFYVIVIIIVEVLRPCARLPVLSFAFAVASRRQIRPDLYIQGGPRCTWELNAYSSYIPTNETHLKSGDYHMEQTLGIWKCWWNYKQACTEV